MKFSEVSVQLMYKLAGSRGRATIQPRYFCLADYERIGAGMDKEEAYCKLLKSIMGVNGESPGDKFFRVI